MINRIFLSIGIMCLTLVSFAQKQNQEFLNYIEKYADLAIQEMERAGIPASIKLAQGLLESSAGKSFLARRGNNHFGIKCGNDWDGKKVFKEDDDFDDRGKLIKSCFRSYRNVKASYIAHSEFLRDPRKVHRYGFLFRLEPTDYKRWARGLKKAGYATSATYDKKLIKLIEDYELYKFDSAIPLNVDDQPEVVIDDESGTNTTIVQRVNDVKYLLSQEGELVSDLARRGDVSVRSLVKYNEKIESGSEGLKRGTRVFIQPKRSNYRGKKLYHKVEPGEHMFYISQMYAVKLSRLYSCNQMEEGTEPAVGELIRLKGKAKERPRLRSESEENFEELDLITEDEPEKEERPNRVKDKPKPNPREDKPQPPKDSNPEFDDEMEFEEEIDIFEEEEEEFVPPIIDDIIIEPVEKEKPPVVIPPKREEIPEPPVVEEPKVTPPVDAVYYTVERGDTLWAISRKFDTTVDSIKRLNNLSSNYIRRGMQLRVK